MVDTSILLPNSFTSAEATVRNTLKKDL